MPGMSRIEKLKIIKEKKMKKITAFEYNGCPYCAQAKKAIEELIKENSEYGKIEIEWIEEHKHPEIIANYDYQSTPAMFIDKEKIYESHLYESFDECKTGIKEVFDRAIS